MLYKWSISIHFTGSPSSNHQRLNISECSYLWQKRSEKACCGCFLVRLCKICLYSIPRFDKNGKQQASIRWYAYAAKRQPYQGGRGIAALVFPLLQPPPFKNTTDNTHQHHLCPTHCTLVSVPRNMPYSKWSRAPYAPSTTVSVITSCLSLGLLGFMTYYAVVAHRARS